MQNIVNELQLHPTNNTIKTEAAIYLRCDRHSSDRILLHEAKMASQRPVG